MIFRLGLYILAAAASTAHAINIDGYATTSCSNTGVATCTNIRQNTCCGFSRGGLQVQLTLFSLLYSGTIGNFYQSSSSSLCGGVTRDSRAGPATSACLSGGYLSNYFGGGAAWFDCLHCAAEDSKVARSDEIASNFSCNSTAIPTIFGWDGEGVWVLEPEEGEAWDQYNELPVTTDYDVHLENLKSFGATWYENARDHPVAAEMLQRVQ
ncbi:hypothetical protein DTO271G3_2557 [Paecilomyces variotii]|nr:hypothetical protein DTO271G3_2557 [Paecilomyces variotii]